MSIRQLSSVHHSWPLRVQGNIEIEEVQCVFEYDFGNGKLVNIASYEERYILL